ncbi:PilT protein domain protein [Ferroglobus placidus DSM 10642]|uniref:PilT protein domain protein n=1 Tax=Ferroglobus placidus (strain DSM 10642 / AEDII12DO) TaxID=589924 RepID=D3RYZ9_FERPA|nr:type II toxin-antitoxin system VapC family toxin [Ferroglobus placidus]ADC65712.1 PilT protein domain protein [Ferroglobus placidus DSM 10642]
MAVLDTSVIIEIARGNRKALNAVLSEDNYFYITSITWFEIKVGAPKLAELNLVDSLECLSFDRKSADVAAEIYIKLKKDGKMVSLKDLFIGAICISNKEKLITMDSDFEILRDFGLEVVFIKQ